MITRRINSLDGLRTVAILMVVLTHIPLTWLPPLNRFIQPLVYFIFSGGKLGVSILFVMTGLLMGWLHPQPKRTIEFWSRRLARIFPLFLVMVISLTLIQANSGLPLPAQLGTVLGLAVLARILHRQIGRKLTLIWLGLMLTAAGGYIFWLNKIPPSVYYQVWPSGWRIIITALANATMALPFGRYIPQLDGVYWALIAEVWFYLLYPVLFVPLINRRRSLDSFVASLFFCFGLSLIADRVLGLKMLEPALTIYFIIGVGLGRNLTWWQQRIKPLPPLLLLTLLSAGQYWLTRWLPELYSPWVRLILAPLTGWLVLSAAADKNWLSHPLLTKLSRYTYAMFLTHSLVINWIYRLVQPTDLWSGVRLIFFSLTAVLTVSVILHNLAEKPYFLTRHLANTNTAINPRKPLLGLTIITLVLLDIAFRPPLAFFTSIARIKGDKETLILGEKPSRFSFVGKNNNLGMITSHLLGREIPGAKTDSQTEPMRVIIRLYDESQQLLAENSYKAADIYEDRYHPFGFPVQTGSQGKKYTLEYQLTQPDPGRQIKLIGSEEKFIAVYFRPDNRTRWLVNKLTAPFTSPLYWTALACLASLILTLTVNGRWRRG